MKSRHPAHVQWPSTIKSLGIPIGSDEAVADLWEKKTTKAIAGCFADWRARCMPKTGYGRTLVIKASAMSRAWYLVSNGMPPNSKSLNAYMQEWRRLCWDFHYEN